MVTGPEITGFLCTGFPYTVGGVYEIVDVNVNLLVWSCEWFVCCLDDSWRQWGATWGGATPASDSLYPCECMSYEPISLCFPAVMTPNTRPNPLHDWVDLLWSLLAIVTHEVTSSKSRQ